jgi:DNA replication initiation complex subunit (GINS family)|tara:strand:- start:1 stop:642 length:642 start_codon:yes stop_codon:yes gene_type:complete
MPPDVITYEKLYEILRMEKFRTDLQKLPENFLESVKTYLEEKSKILERQKEKDSSMFQSELNSTQRQLENVRKIIKEIYDRRENKILQNAVFSARSGAKELPNLLEHEKEFYDSLLELLASYRKGILTNLLSNKEIEKPKPKSIKNQDKESFQQILRFNEAIPRFVAENMRSYGPFDVEDVAVVPTHASKILIEKKKAEVISNEETKERKKVL